MHLADAQSKNKSISRSQAIPTGIDLSLPRMNAWTRSKGFIQHLGRRPGLITPDTGLWGDSVYVVTRLSRAHTIVPSHTIRGLRKPLSLPPRKTSIAARTGTNRDTCVPLDSRVQQVNFASLGRPAAGRRVVRVFVEHNGQHVTTECIRLRGTTPFPIFWE